MTVHRVKQLSVFLANRPGVLAKLARSLAEGGVNLTAITVSDTVDHAVIRLVVDRPERALGLLEANGALVIETEVLALTLANRPGMLAKVADKLARAKVNIEYAYGSVPSAAASSALVYLRVSDNRKAERALRAV